MLPPAVDSNIFEAVSNALYGDCWLDMEYLNQDGIGSKSLVQPLGLAQQQAYDDEGRFGFGDGSLVQLSFTITQDRSFHITESPLSRNQEVIEAGDYLKISATVNDTEQLDWWLLGLGEDISDVRKEKI